MKIARGFTLIELMIVIAIVGVLVAIAYPSYTNSLIKGNRAAAKSFMLEVAQKEQQYLLDTRAYFDATTATPATWDAVGIKVPTEVTNFYDVVADGDNTTTPPSFTITATAKGRQLKDGNLTLNHQGTKTPAEKW